MTDEDVLRQLEEQLGDITEPTDVVDLTMLSKLALLDRRDEILGRLRAIDEFTGPRSTEGHHLHAELVYIVAEIHRRRP